MEKTKHTPEPWYHEKRKGYTDRWVREEASGATIARICDDDGHIDTPDPMPLDANAARIVACVNACAGIENPAAIPQALEALRLVSDCILNDTPGDVRDGVCLAAISTALAALGH